MSLKRFQSLYYISKTVYKRRFLVRTACLNSATNLAAFVHLTKEG